MKYSSFLSLNVNDLFKGAIIPDLQSNHPEVLVGIVLVDQIPEQILDINY